MRRQVHTEQTQGDGAQCKYNHHVGYRIAQGGGCTHGTVRHALTHMHISKPLTAQRRLGTCTRLRTSLEGSEAVEPDPAQVPLIQPTWTKEAR